MEVIVCADQEEAADRVAAEILAAHRRKPDLALGLATGSTPIGVYKRIIQSREETGRDFSRLRTFNLDEYLGLTPGHPQSYRHFMQTHLFSGLNVPPGSIHFPPTEGPDLEAKCAEYERHIEAAGGIDLQLLGVGSNGHIGFNEPASSLASRTQVTVLTEKTIDDNARFYAEGEYQPHVAVTMGVGTIRDAGRILLQAFGAKKAPAIQAAVEGPVSSLCPASALQLHPRVTLYLDRAASSELRMTAHYLKTAKVHEHLRRNNIL